MEHLDRETDLVGENKGLGGHEAAQPEELEVVNLPWGEGRTTYVMRRLASTTTARAAVIVALICGTTRQAAVASARPSPRGLDRRGEQNAVATHPTDTVI